MSTHGTCFTFATSGFGVDRSNSRLSKDRLLRLVSRQTKPNKPTCSSPAPTGVQSSSLSTRSFLLKTGKMRISHRKEKSGDSIASIRQAEAVPIEALWTEGKQVIFEGKPVAVERRHAGTDGKQVVERKQIDVGPSGPVTNIMTVPPKALSTNSTKIDAAKAAEKEMRSNKAGAIFEGLPKTGKNDLSSNDLIDHDFLKRAFGITMEETTGVLEDLPRQKADASTNLTTVLEADKDLFEMDVPLQLAKDRRPELQVSIPSAKVASRSGRLQQETPFTVSPPSTCTPSRQNKPFNGVATARLSIVSPLSVVEMPKPRRPFSAQSLEGMTAETPKSTAPAVKSATSNSSDDISERGTKSSRGRSPRSSMSSISSDRPVRPSNEDLSNTTKLAENCGVLASRVSSTNAGAIGHGTVAPNVPKNMRSTPSLRSSPSPIRPSLRDKASYTSIKSTVSSINKNKPLPPEPGVSNTTPINVTNHSPSRSSTMAVRQRMPGSQQSRYNGEAQVASLNASRRSSTRSGTLRSKYTPKDLDALDDAFQRNLPNRTQSTFSYYNNSTPTLSQVTLALETQLDTIKEDSPNNSLCMPMVNDPLQISRGPMRMEPSRRPPVPTCCAGSPCHDRPETRKRLMKRSASSNHVISQMRSHDSIPRRRASTNVVGSNNKANKILGKTGGYTTPVRMERKGSMDSNWSSGDSPEMYTNTTSPAMSAGGIQTPESELSIIPDAHFEEIRRRLELLSPKEDPSQTFLAFHQRNVSRSHEKLFADIKLVSLPDPRPMEKPKEKRLHEHIMELEAISSPSIAELEDTQQMVEAVEMGLPSPLPMLALPSIEEDSKPSAPQGRKDTLSPDSATQTTKLSGKNRSVNSSQRSVKARSLASLAMSEIPDLYASIPSPPESRIRPSMTAEEVELLISADAAERVLLRILQSLDNLKDLFAAAEVSRGFYRTFKRHELFLIKNALWCMSPAAWELRQMSIPYSELEDGATDYRPNMYLQHYIRDLLTMVKLKAMILDHCKTFLRPETISGLAGETDASPHIDDAFWRVWTFCRIFGCGKGREDDIVGQMDWLKGGVLVKQQSSDTRTLATSDRVAMNSVLFNPPNGFARGNGGGLTAEELYDMTEIWTCLGVLVRGFQGRRQEAREFGIFDGTSITTGDVGEENQALEEWTYYLLSLAPSAILNVTSPTTPTQTTFTQIRSQGYTSWRMPSRGTSRSTFLKEAVTRVYDEKMAVRRPSEPEAPNSFSTLPQVIPSSPQPPSPEKSDADLAQRHRRAVHAAEIRAKKQDPNYKDVPVSEERPMSNYPDVLARLEAQGIVTSTNTSTNPPPPKMPSLASRFSLRRPKVTVTSPMRSKKSSKPASPAPPAAPPSRQQQQQQQQQQQPTPELAATHPEPLPSSHSPGASISQEKLPLYPHMQPLPTIPTGPQVRDPVDVAVERLTQMGFETSKAKKALAETDSGNSVDFGRAVSLLIREKERRKCLGRLDRMG